MAAALIPESALSTVVGKLLDAASSYLAQHQAPSDMADEVERLRQQALPEIQLISAALEGTPIADRHEEVERWLWQLRDAVEGADDALDELHYYELEKKVRARDRREVRASVSRRKRKYVDFANRIFSHDAFESLMEAVKELNKVAAGTRHVTQIVASSYGGGLALQTPCDVKKARETRSCLIENEVLGRDKERDVIVEWLTKQVDDRTSSSDDAGISTFAIVGPREVGKTALAQLVCWDGRVRRYFDLITWVCVSEHSDGQKILRKILEDATGRSIDSQDLDALGEMAKERLISKRFLLVLDDVRNTGGREWDKLISALKFAQRGSKILVTTDRYHEDFTPNNVNKSETKYLQLCGLEENDYMMLFDKHAFARDDPGEHEDLLLIGKQIAGKLGGMPLSAQVVGRVLSSRMDDGHWQSILNYIMNLEQSEGGLKVLSEWSCDRLPTHLQACFRYCALFPRGYMFEKDKLVSMWMASGLIQRTVHENKKPEDIGAEYLNILTDKSFFDRKSSDLGKFSDYYYIKHDLLYELARYTSSGECLRIKGACPKNIPSTLRHLSLESVAPLEIRMISHLKNLRTLAVSSTDFCNPEPDHLYALNEVLKGLKSLRLFSLNVYVLRNLPDPIGTLIHLRYLSLRQECSRENLLDFFCYPVYGLSPRRVLDWFAQSVYRLYHLEVMETSAFSKVNFDKTELDGLGNLINLRRLHFPNDTMIKIPWIGKLTSLQELNDFNVRGESGYRITILKGLKDLRQLYVGNLQNVTNHEEAVEAELNVKTNLKSLTLEWSVGPSRVSETDEQILDNLRPHDELRELKLGGYNGVRFPYWIKSEFLPYLQSVVLFNCHKLEDLPPLGQLQHLKLLHLNAMRAVKIVGHSFYGSGDYAFPFLRELKFEDMPEWVEWVGVEDGLLFPKLEILEIKDCPGLRRLPTLPCSVRRLSITNAGLVDLPEISIAFSNKNEKALLSSLHIFDCPKLQLLSNALGQTSPTTGRFPFLESGNASPLMVSTRYDISNNQSMPDSFFANDQCSPTDDHQDGETALKGEQASPAVGAPAEDGYNWRKYGKKQVKHSEFPTSYYECTHPNCPVKKKVERSHKGHRTKIIYKGNHNHPKPPVNHQRGVPSSHPFSESQVDGAEKSLWANTEYGAPQDWVGDAVDVTSSASVAATLCDPSAPIQSQDGGARFESADDIDVSSTLSNGEEEDDGVAHGSVSLACDGEGDEAESKRRKLDACAFEMSAALKAVCEPRVVVQRTSEVDIFDDGYRWRKYGQKAVKGNPNPRSYYKCTHPGCSVRKHVERASHDLKSVITTYEGKHNHGVVAARNSNHPIFISTPSALGTSQSNSMQRRAHPTQDGLVRFNDVASLGPMGLPPRDHLGPPVCFSFGLGQLGPTNIRAPAEDGHTWRIYRQKHVKDSEIRSYYRCTHHPNCSVRKQVALSHEGHITEIIYKGNHNHPKPPVNESYSYKEFLRFAKLTIGRCGRLDVVLLESLSSLTSLSQLRIDDCTNISFLPSAKVFARLKKLHKLEILNCKNLESLGGIQALRSLRYMLICGCGKLTAVSSLLPPAAIDVGQGDTTTGSSLNLDELEVDHHLLLLVEPLRSLCSTKRLVITDASSLAFLPEEWLLRNRASVRDITVYDAVCLHTLPLSMASFCTLHTLKLFHAPLIESLPDLPTSLSTLCITDCHPLLKKRCQEDIGLDWCKIAHIPHVRILERFHADDS